MNKWKIAFWICFVILFFTIAIGLDSIIDQGVTITYMKDGYSKTESDLEDLIAIFNKTDLTKGQIRDRILKSKGLDEVTMNRDTIYLNRMGLIFKEDKLSRINEHWWIKE